VVVDTDMNELPAGADAETVKAVRVTTNEGSSIARRCWTKPRGCFRARGRVIAGVIAFYASARSLQIGDGVEVIALTSVTANLIAIFGGIIVFHDPIGSGPVEIGARFLAFCFVIAGAALMPPPMRATPDTASASSQPQRAASLHALGDD
jgi:hypothetical protein